MERLIRETLGEARQAVSARIRLRSIQSGVLIPNIALMLVSALLASYAPFDEVSPFGAACVMAAWTSGADPYFACTGAVLGYVMTGNYAYAVSTLILGAAIFLLNREGSILRLYRLLLSFGIQLVSLLLISLIARLRILYYVGALTVSVFAAVVIAGGFKAFESLPGDKSFSDAELLTLSATAGLITLSMRSFNLWGISPAMIFAGACALFAAYRLGISSVAFAVTVGAGRVLAAGGDMHFIAMLAALSLLASSVRALGKWASLSGFALLGLAFTYLIRGTYVFGPFELGLICLIFALVPSRLYMPDGVKEELLGSPMGEKKYGRLQYRIASLSDVINELAEVCGEREGRILRCVAKTLQGSLRSSSRRIRTFSADYGSASAAVGAAGSGDSCSVKMIGGNLLAAISDGMGSGSRAAKESRKAIALLSDLLTVGFGVGEAAEYVNEMLSSEGDDEVYATMDVMLIDLDDGEAHLLKHGAPASFVLRDGNIYTLCGEGVPVGIIDEVKGRVKRVKLSAGDTVVMMTDGVSDALGDMLIPAVADNVLEFGDAEMAASSLLDAALDRGHGDDMTVIVARITAADKRDAA